MKTYIVLLILVSIAGWYFGDRFGNETTVYRAFCAGNRENLECKSGEETANPTTYKAIIEQQTVVYWTGDSHPYRFRFCAVRDARNWACKDEAETEIATVRYVMSNGDYLELVDAPLRATKGDVFYIVSKFRWWKLRLSEWLQSKRKV